MLFKGNPREFKPDCHCVGCHIVWQGQLLLLQKPANHPLYSSQWGVVAGKRLPGEPFFKAIAREGLEEIGWQVDQHQYDYLASYPVIHPHMKFMYHLFRLDIPGELPKISLSSEHVSIAWAPPLLAVQYDLIEDESALISHHLM